MPHPNPNHSNCQWLRTLKDRPPCPSRRRRWSRLMRSTPPRRSDNRCSTLLSSCPTSWPSTARSTSGEMEGKGVCVCVGGGGKKHGTGRTGKDSVQIVSISFQDRYQTKSKARKSSHFPLFSSFSQLGAGTRALQLHLFFLARVLSIYAQLGMSAGLPFSLSFNRTTSHQASLSASFRCLPALALCLSYSVICLFLAVAFFPCGVMPFVARHHTAKHCFTKHPPLTNNRHQTISAAVEHLSPLLGICRKM